jgi:RimJ/RimL family protein N-acetyltransferase
VPGPLDVPGLDVPGLDVPGLDVPAGGTAPCRAIGLSWRPFRAHHGTVQEVTVDLTRALTELTGCPPERAVTWWLRAWESGDAASYAELRPLLEADLPYSKTPLTWAGPRVVAAGDLLLRPLHVGDAAALVAGADASVGRWTSTPYPLTLPAAEALIADAARRWADGAGARFAVVEAGSVVGTAGLLHVDAANSDAEVGYWLAPSARGRGLGRRSTQLLCDWAVTELGCGRLHLEVDWDNPASHRTALACGFVPVGPVAWTDPRDGRVSICLKYVR